MMKNKIIHSFLYIVCCFFVFNAEAQDISNYFLAPTGLILPVGEKIDIKIRWEDHTFSDKFHEGTAAILSGLLPAWSIVSKPNTVANKDEGSIATPLSMMDAVYTAPEKIPSVNPVTVAVKFKANDTSKQEVTLLCTIKIVDPGQNWFFSYSYLQSAFDKTVSQSEEHYDEVNVNANSSMIISAAPPDKGYVLINTGEGDSILDYASGGSYSEDVKDVSYEVNRTVAEKMVRHCTGQPSKRRSGLEFSYNPSDGGGIQGAGLTFDITGTDKFWVPGDAPGQLKETTESIDDKNARSILLGHSKDVVKKIKNGFSIDYRQSKDTTYTDFKGTHTIKMTEQYHAQLTRVNKKMK